MYDYEKIVFIVLLSILFLLTSCSAGKVAVSGTALMLHPSRMLAQYNSPYTLCEKNDDTYSFYIFSSPIQFADQNGKYHLIDNSLVRVKQQPIGRTSYLYTNKQAQTQCFFGSNLNDCSILLQKEEKQFFFSPEADHSKFQSSAKKRIKNMYRLKTDCVQYQYSDRTITCYPSNSGVTSEIVLQQMPKNNTLSFLLQDTPFTSFTVNSAGYISFFQSSVLSANFSFTFASESSGNVCFRPDIQVEALDEDSHGYRINLDFTKYASELGASLPLTCLTSCDFYENKIPDSPIFSKVPNENSYLNDISVLGSHPELGTSVQYLRFRLNAILKCIPSDVLSASLYIPEILSSGDPQITMYQAEEEWFSRLLTWSTQAEASKAIQHASPQSGGLEFDITEYVKQCVSDTEWQTESYGAVLKGGEAENTYRILASNDNMNAIPYVKVDLAFPPVSFTSPGDNINPQN